MSDVNQDIAIQERTELHGSFSDSTYEIISKVAYLIGVPKRIFENIVEAPKMEYYDLLQADKPARIIRNLCVIRTYYESTNKSAWIHSKDSEYYLPWKHIYHQIV